MANTLKFKRGLLAGLPAAAEGEPLFTTDTADLYIGTSTGTQKFQKFIASGATTQILRGDGSLFTFPLTISSPTNGQVLKYNGTAWVNDSDAGITGSGSSGQVAYFTGATTQAGNNNLFWDISNARLGVGTNVPSQRLDVSGYVRATSGFVGNSGLQLWADNTSIANGARLTTGGNFIINNPTIDTGQRLQVIGDIYANANTASYIAQLNQTNTTAGSSFGAIIRGGTNVSDTALRIQNAAQTANLLTVQGNGSLGLGTTLLTGYNVRINKSITGNAVAYGLDIDGTIQSDVVTSAVVYGTTIGTQATSFTLSQLYHYNATQGTFGAGSTVTSQFGYRVSFNMIGAVNNYAFYGEIPSGTGRWNLYCNGTADNYMAGRLAIGSASTSGGWLNIFGNGADRAVTIATTFSGSATRFGILQFNTVNSDVTSGAINNYSQFQTQAATFNLTSATHYTIADVSVGAGSTITNQYGYRATAIQTATNNYGFFGELTSGTNRWNLYMVGTAANHLAGQLLIGTATTSTYLLDVVGQTRFRIGTNALTAATGLHYMGQSASTNFIGFNFQGVAASDMFFGRAASSDDLIVSTSNTGSPQEVIRFRQNRNVGIGTPTPGTRLQVLGGTLTPATQTTYALGVGNVGFELTFGTDANNAYIQTWGSKPLFLNNQGNLVVLGSGTVTSELFQVYGTMKVTGATTFSSTITSTQFLLSALNTAPATSSSTGTLGEIRIDANHIYVCTATNTWKRVAIATF